MNKLIDQNETNEEGSALVEFAILLPTLLVMVMGMIQFGMILANKITLQSAAATGARYVVIHPTASASTVEGIAQQAVSPMIPTSAVQAHLTNTTLNGQPAFQVKVDYQMPLILPFAVPNHVGNRLNLSATTIMQ